MVLRMSISSVPGTNSVFFASLPIDYLPIDKIWEKVRALDRACQVAWKEVSLPSNRRRPAIPLLSDTTRQYGSWRRRGSQASNHVHQRPAMVRSPQPTDSTDCDAAVTRKLNGRCRDNRCN